MKAATIALGVLCAILAFALYQRGATAGRELDVLLKDAQTASNQVAEIRTRMALAAVESASTTSNLHRQLEKRTADLNIVSNRLVQTHLLLQAAQKEGRSDREQLLAGASRIATLEGEVAALRASSSRANALEQLARERDAARRELAEIVRERDGLRTQLGASRVEAEALQAQLFDVVFLERQLKDAKVAADIRERMASARAGASPDRRLKLELQADGTVRFQDPPTARK